MMRIAPAIVVLFTLVRPAMALPAFPGAEGFGAESLGGRGSGSPAPTIKRVTTLADGVPTAPAGSLREALEASGPRFVVFEVGGVIHLKDVIRIDDPFITIAGQTAPGDGIGIDRDPSGYPPTGDIYPNLIEVLTHDVVLQHLRLRPGNQGVGVGPYCSTAKVSSISIKSNASDVVVDHCSLSWDNDSQVEIAGTAQDVTIQFSILAEGVDGSDASCTYQDPSQGFAGFGAVSDVSVHHNLFAYDKYRNPLINGGLWDVVNNVMYNSWVTTEVADSENVSRVDLNYVANRLIAGSNGTTTPMVRAFKFFDENPAISTRGFRIFLDGNVGPGTGANTYACWRGYTNPASTCTTPSDWTTGTRHTTPSVTTLTPVVSGGTETLWLALRDQIGATIPARDYVDDCVADEVDKGASGRSGWLYDESDGCRGTSAWTLSSASWPGSRDADHDGMPDTDFESYWGVSDPVADADADGYLNIEEFLNDTIPVPEELETETNVNDGQVLEGVSADHTAGYRVGDHPFQIPWISVLSFDTGSALADDAVITSARVRMVLDSTTGNPTTLGSLVADVATGSFGAAQLEIGDGTATATATAVATFSDSGGGVWTGELNAAGLAAVNRTGLTQFRVRFASSHDGDTASDYRQFSSTTKPTLELSIE